MQPSLRSVLPKFVFAADGLNVAAILQLGWSRSSPARQLLFFQQPDRTFSAAFIGLMSIVLPPCHISLHCVAFPLLLPASLSYSLLIHVV